MSKNQNKIKKALEIKGYKATKITYEPLGGMIEMVGREGGWAIEIEPNDYIFGYNTKDVIENIEQLPNLLKEE